MTNDKKFLIDEIEYPATPPLPDPGPRDGHHEQDGETPSEDEVER